MQGQLTVANQFGIFWRGRFDAEIKGAPAAEASRIENMGRYNRSV